MSRPSILWSAVAALLLGLGTSGTASASSCRPYSERYFMLCREGACEGAFRVSEVPAFGSCGRRTDVATVDVATTRFLAPVLEHARPQGNGLFELGLPLHRPRAEQPLVAALTHELALRQLTKSENGKIIDVASASPGDVASLMARAYGPHWIAQVSAETSDEAVQAAKRKLEQAAKQDRWRDLSHWAAFWGSFLIVLSIFVHSIHLFFLRLHRHARDRRRRSLWTPLLMQAGVGTVGICVPVFTRFELWPGVLLLPAVATILLAEAWAWLRRGEPPAVVPARISDPTA